MSLSPNKDQEPQKFLKPGREQDHISPERPGHSARSKGPDRVLWRYAGFATQLFVALGISVFLGLKADEWLALSFPVLVWVLPLMVIIFTIYKLIKDTQKKK